jgi:hypothetical protein
LHAIRWASGPNQGFEDNHQSISDYDFGGLIYVANYTAKAQQFLPVCNLQFLCGSPGGAEFC